MQIPFDTNTSSSQNLLILIDGHAIIHRAFRGISAQGNNLTVSSTGEDVTGVYGFLNIFLRAISDRNPSHCIITFDTPKPTFRHIAFPDYKAQRAETPEELKPQFERVRQMMETFAVPTFSLDGYEADDLIGTISAQAEEHGLETIILTGDRDTFQLISPYTKVDLGSNARDRKLYGESELIARYNGLTAEQQPDFKALLGDNSDNIPGVPRVGEKRAIALLNSYVNLEGIYGNLESIHPPSVKTSLTESKNIAFNNRELMTIDRQVPITVDFESALFGGYDMEQVINLLKELEFNSIISRIPGTKQVINSDMAISKPVANTDTVYTCVDNQEKFDSMMLSLQKAHKIAFDTETSDLNPMLASIVGLSFSTNAGSAWYIPVGHSEGLQLSLEYVIEQLKPVFENPDKQMCAHNANYDLMILSKYGIHVTNLTFDTMVGAHLLGNSSLGLKNLSQTLLGIDMQPITELIGTGKKQISFSDVSIEEAYPYAAADADCTLQLWNHFEPKIDSSFAKNIMSNIEML